ncbi:MAG: hypothetical protein L6R41_007929 [Letrouitia leprolyta]|nr:MAG: hypothetical protein L6R41_007929 [Letrouitia leprolyta]
MAEADDWIQLPSLAPHDGYGQASPGAVEEFTRAFLTKGIITMVVLGLKDRYESTVQGFKEKFGVSADNSSHSRIAVKSTTGRRSLFWEDRPALYKTKILQ